MDDSLKPPADRLRAWLALLHAPGLGSRSINRLIDQVGDPTRLLREPALAGTLQRIDGQALRQYLKTPDQAAIERDLAWLEQPAHHLITRDDPRYPALLAGIDDPPPMLFVHGDPQLLNTPQLAMVGSRNPTASGRQSARDFAHHLAAAGLTITSGLALGIDAACHQGALDAQGTTIAVTGTGLDRVYPARHRELAHRIVASGLLVSEFPPGTAPHPGNFPRRNRIISGLSLGTLVVEAAKQSGSLITARLAAEQGREIFAIPGSIHNPLVRGCHALIREGAKLVETSADIIEELGALLAGLEDSVAENPAEPPVTATRPRTWDADYQRLFEHLGFDPLPVDLLIQRSGLTADAVSSMLILLELDGYVTALPGGRYQLTGKP